VKTDAAAQFYFLKLKASKGQAMTVGKKVPAFTAQSTGGEVKLSHFKGSQLVLYFYPKDNTPGCTTQTSDFGQAYKKFKAAGAQVLGVSRDSIKSHENFKAKLELPFELISDADEALCAAFDVIKMKNMYGKQVRGIERSTFLIDADGKLKQEWRGVKVAGHVDEVLSAVKS
jgi:thioredoxin-dependent peroxiredoxin